MKRTITCFWGGQSCLGFTNKPEEETHCDDHSVVNRLCPSARSNQTYAFATNNTEERKFRLDTLMQFASGI